VKSSPSVGTSHTEALLNRRQILQWLGIGAVFKKLPVTTVLRQYAYYTRG